MVQDYSGKYLYSAKNINMNLIIQIIRNALLFETSYGHKLGYSYQDLNRKFIIKNMHVIEYYAYHISKIRKNNFLSCRSQKNINLFNINNTFTSVCEYIRSRSFH